MIKVSFSYVNEFQITNDIDRNVNNNKNSNNADIGKFRSLEQA